MSKRWYVVQSKSKCEMEAYDNLRNQRYDVYFPQIVETRIVRGKSVTLPVALFPSYLFVQFDITRNKWRSILGTRGVQHLLGSTDVYASPLPKGFVEELIKQSDKRGYLSLKSAGKVVAKYKPGDLIRIKDGLFVGFSGNCHKVQQDFVTLIIALQSGNFEIKLPLESLEPA